MITTTNVWARVRVCLWLCVPYTFPLSGLFLVAMVFIVHMFCIVPASPLSPPAHDLPDSVPELAASAGSEHQRSFPQATGKDKVAKSSFQRGIGHLGLPGKFDYGGAELQVPRMQELIFLHVHSVSAQERNFPIPGTVLNRTCIWSPLDIPGMNAC